MSVYFALNQVLVKKVTGFNNESHSDNDGGAKETVLDQNGQVDLANVIQENPQDEHEDKDQPVISLLKSYIV